MNKKWCFYCKEEIREGDCFVLIDGEYYHLDCAKIINTYYDPFDDNEGVYPYDVINDEVGDL